MSEQRVRSAARLQALLSEGYDDVILLEREPGGGYRATLYAGEVVQPENSKREGHRVHYYDATGKYIDKSEKRVEICTATSKGLATAVLQLEACYDPGAIEPAD